MVKRTLLKFTFIRTLGIYCIMLLTFLYGSNLLELCKICGSDICDSEGYCLPQRNDIECSRDVLTFGGACYSQSWGCLSWIWIRKIQPKRRRLLLLQEELQCVCLILWGGGPCISFSNYTYVCMYGISIKPISVTVRVTVNLSLCQELWKFSDFKLFSNVTLGLKVTVLSYILFH